MSDLILAVQKVIMIAGLVSLALIIGAVAYVYLRDAAVAAARHFSKHGRSVPVLAFAAVMILYGGTKPDTPPVILEQGIKLTQFDVDDGLSVTWETTDDRIEVGTDEFIIRVSDRQIPARTGWSAWRELGRTTNTSFSAGGFWRNRDVRLRIEADTGEVK